MKLSKLYCNQPDFKNVTFNLSGLNVVYADVFSKREEKKNSHDLGKTKLAELIDFLLIKQVGDYKRHFLFKIKDDQNNSIFNDYIFYLEVLLASGNYLTIKRAIQDKTKASFSISETRSDGYTPPNDWEHVDLGIKASKEVLSNYIAFDFFKNKPYDFRKAINYSLRMQGDYEDVYKLSKYVGGNDKDWKPFMFDLLGFDGGLLRAKYENDEKREDIKNYVSKLKNEFSVQVEQRDDIVAQIKLEEQESVNIEAQIDSFNFYEQDKALIKEGIEELEETISDLNSVSYNLNYEIDRLQKSISNKFAFNVSKIKQVFDESKIYFSEQLEKDYDELLEFNNKLTTERNRLLKKSLAGKRIELAGISDQLKGLNTKRENLLSYLKDTDAFRKFKFYQKELVKVEGQILALKNKLETIDKIIKEENRRDDLLKEIEGTVKTLRDIYGSTEDNEKYSDIRTKFSGFYKAIMDEDARISWNINTNNNVDFVPPKVTTKNTNKDTAKDEGNTYRKLLCVAFDLCILASYNKESYYRFVYHDDVLSQEDHGIKLRLLELIQKLCSEFDLQYMLSVISSDLPTDSDGKLVYFSDEEIVLRLHDKDSSGTLFGFEF